MDAIIKQAQDVFEGQIDFEGQSLSETISTFMLIAFSIFGLCIGFIQDDLHLAMWIILAGTVLTLFVVVPPWPMYNRNPQSWIGSRTKLSHGSIVVQGMKVS